MSDNHERHVVEVYEIAVLSDGELSWKVRTPTGEAKPVDVTRLEVVLLKLLAWLQRELLASRVAMVQAQSRIVTPVAGTVPGISRQ